MERDSIDSTLAKSHRISVFVADKSSVALFSQDYAQNMDTAEKRENTYMPEKEDTTPPSECVEKMLRHMSSEQSVANSLQDSLDNPSPVSMTPGDSPEFHRCTPTNGETTTLTINVDIANTQSSIAKTSSELFKSVNKVSVEITPVESPSETPATSPLHEGNPLNWSPLSHAPQKFNRLSSTRNSPCPLPHPSDKLANHTIYAGSPAYTKTGFLIKQGGSFKTWRRRFFVLQNKNLFYFNSEADAKKQNVLPLGVIPLTSFFSFSKCRSISNEDYVSLLFSGILKKKPLLWLFKIETVQRTWYLCAESEEDQLEWIRILGEIERANRRNNKEIVNAGDNVSNAGWLDKHTKGVVKRRWCVLRPDSLLLFKAPGDLSPKAVLELDPASHSLEVVSPMYDDSDSDDQTEGKPLFYRFAIHCKDGISHWFRCDSYSDLEVWIYSLQFSIHLVPSCRTLFETLLTSILEGVFRSDTEIDLDDPNSLLAMDSIRYNNPILCFEKDPRIQGLPLSTMPTKRLMEESTNIAKGAYFDIMRLIVAIKLFGSTTIHSEGIEYHLSLVQALLQACLENPPLQNELMLQLVKQTTRHPFPGTTRTIQLYQLFALVLGILTPTGQTYHYVRFHLTRIIQRHDNMLVSDFAYYCLRMLMRIPEGEQMSQIHPKDLPENIKQLILVKTRRSPPSYMEIMNLLQVSDPPTPMRVVIECKNDEMLSVPFEPFATVADVIKTLKTTLGLGNSSSPLPSEEFRLFLRSPDSDGSFRDFDMEILKDDEFIGDIIYRVEHMLRKVLKKPGTGWWWMDETNNIFLVFKIRFFLPNLSSAKDNVVPVILKNCTENEKRFLMNYIVENVSFRKFEYEDLLNVTAYYAQVQWGDHYPLIQNRGLVHSQIQYLLDLFHSNYVPKIKLDAQPGQVFEVITQTDSLLGEISNKWMCLRGKAVEGCLNGFLKLTLNAIVRYPYRVYVEVCGQDMGDICKMDISTSGIKISHYGKQIVKCGYDKVVYYVKGDEKSLILGIHSSAIDEKVLGKKGAQSDSTRILLLLADEKIHSKDFLHIFRHFAEIARK